MLITTLRCYAYRSVRNIQELALRRPRRVAVRRYHPLGTRGCEMFFVAREEQPRILHLDDRHGLLVARPLQVGGLPWFVVPEVHRDVDPRDPEVLLRFELSEDEEAKHLCLELRLLDVDIRCYEGAQPGELGNVSELVWVDVHPFGNGLLNEKKTPLGKRHRSKHEFNLGGELSGSVKDEVNMQSMWSLAFC